jgi:serine/threonine protein kinase
VSEQTDPVKSIFLAALELPGAERASLLDARCGTDRDLRQRVEAMLQAHASSGELLPRPAVELIARADAARDSNLALDSHSERLRTEAHDAGTVEFAFLGPGTKPESIGRLGHYEVLQVIGRGGFGIVFKAFDEKLQRIVAIKVLAPEYAFNGPARKRFVREARAAAAVKGEHVVGIHEVHDQASPPYLVMEFIDGMSLQDKLDRQGPLAVPEILRIGLQMAEALCAAHKQGLVHRDIKPANVLLENGVERVKITDFGLARAIDDASLTQSGTVAGTPMYMSPEQAEGLAIDHRSDLFSLGSVLYAMCTGHPPFRASSTQAVLKRVVEETPRPIREFNAELPEWLELLIAKLHAKTPADRFQSAREVAALFELHLAQWQQSGGTAQGAVTNSPRPGRAPTCERVVKRTPPSLLERIGRARLAGLVALSCLFLAGAIWLGPAISRYLSNRAVLEIVPQPGLEGVFVLQNHANVAGWRDYGAGWRDTRNSRTIRLSPGKYQIDSQCKPGYESKSMVWELTTAGFFGDQAVYHSGPGCEVEVRRGEHVTVRATPRIMKR